MEQHSNSIRRGSPVDLLRSQDLRSPFTSPLPRSRTNSNADDTTPSYYRTNTPPKSVNQPLIEIHPVSTRSTTFQPQCVKWGVSWRTPMFMICCILAGIGAAIGHHSYFMSLNGTPAGSASRQQWAIRFGTAFSFIIIALFKTACDTAYSQYIWTLVKRKSFAFRTLDKLFSLITDPLGFLSLDLMRHAKLAYLVAGICWGMAFAGLTPPATISVVSALHSETRMTSLPALNFHLQSFADIIDGSGLPTPEVIQIATMAGQSMNVVPAPAPGSNASFSMQFYGPTVQCKAANLTQQPLFNNFSNAMWNDADNTFLQIATEYSYNNRNITWGIKNATSRETFGPAPGEPIMLVYSAFAPYATVDYWLDRTVRLNDDSPYYSVDRFGNWIATGGILNFRETNQFRGPLPYTDGSGSLVKAVAQQLMVQASNQSLVCTMGNASFDVAFEFINGVQTLARYTTSDFQPFWLPVSGESMSSLRTNNKLSATPDQKLPMYSYMAHFLAFSSLLNGNVTQTLFPDYYNVDDIPGNMRIHDATSKILQTGLSACSYFTDNYWKGNELGQGLTGPVPWQDSIDLNNPPNKAITWGKNFTNITNTLFENKPAWMCRNRTLMRAIENLANNITISMLSSANLVSQNATTLPVTYTTTLNIYSYDSFNLLLSYSIAIFLTLLVASLGFWSFHYNGVAHSNTFSAMVATTNSSELHALSKGHSLGAVPFEKELENVKIRFGILMGEGEKRGCLERDRRARHIGFGRAENVVPIVKGGNYI